MNRRINLVFLIIIGSLLPKPFKVEKYFENGKIRIENLYRNNKLVK